ncbi:MAG TPA: IS66 family transposase [candidate division Zixibacteria bacterium]|nr:IS66 family transposase [candidate division Zixibacteria bacterium]
MIDNPDKTEVLVSDYCQCCGNDLSDVSPIFISKRQVVDLPEIKPIYTEYQSFSRKCSCGHEQVADYPTHVGNHIQYGASVEAAVGYYSVYQYLPYKRMSELFSHFYNLPISEGTIGNMLESIGERIQPIYDSIQDTIAKSKTAVGGDESGAKVNGKKFWAWIWQTLTHTYIIVSPSRGKKVIDQFFPGGFKNAVLVSDRWKSHINTHAKGHQLCFAHLLRELNYLIELEATGWAKSIKTLFKQAIELKRKIPEYSESDHRALEIETNFNQLLNQTLGKNKTPKTLTFQNSLIDYRDYLFTFLYNKDVPADNNASERGIRNFKVKLKISGQFKTGHNAFAKIRSFIDTCKKNNIPVLHALKLVAQMPIQQAV